MMKQDLVNFFDKFVTDFKSFDGTIIANRYLAPYTAISSKGVVVLYTQHQDIKQYFTSILTDYKSQEVDHCTYSHLEFSKLGSISVIATVEWSMKKKDEMIVAQWRESYILVLADETLKIVTSIDH